jgi:hypothetical protein
MIGKILLYAALLLFPLTAIAAEKGQLRRADSLREKPFADAGVAASLAPGQNVEIEKRQGAWYQVRANGRLGWVNMLSVRRTSSPAAVSAGSLGQIATGRAGTGKVVAATGVRGLNEEELRDATFQEEPVALVERFRVSDEEARQFARAAGLQPRQVTQLPPTAAAPAKGGRP